MAQKIKHGWRRWVVVATAFLLYAALVHASSATQPALAHFFVDSTWQETVACRTPSAQTSQGGCTDIFLMTPGTYYRAEVAGMYFFARPYSFRQADAECSRNHVVSADDTWAPDRYSSQTTSAGDDPLDLTLDGLPRDWTPINENKHLCDAGDHRYKVDFTPDDMNGDGLPRPVKAWIYDPFGRSDNFGSLEVKIFPGTEPVQRPGDVALGAFAIDAQDAASVTLPIVPKETYRLVASGTYFYKPDLVMDSTCSFQKIKDEVWRRERQIVVNTQGNTTEVMGDLYVNGTNVDWEPLSNTGAPADPNQRCNDTVDTLTDKVGNTLGNAYRYQFTAADGQDTLHLVINPLYRPFASGKLMVRLFNVSKEVSVSTDAAKLPATSPGDGQERPTIPCRMKEFSSGIEAISSLSECTFTVPSDDPRGVEVELMEERPYFIRAKGFYYFLHYGRLQHATADAECSRNYQVAADSTWLPNRYGHLTNDPTDDPLDLYVDGRTLEWMPMTDVGACDAANNYSLMYFPPLRRQAGDADLTPRLRWVKLHIYDPFRPFNNVGNAGSLEVEIFPGREPIAREGDVHFAEVVVDTRAANGTNIVLPGPGLRETIRTYRIVVNGPATPDQEESDAQGNRKPAPNTYTYYNRAPTFALADAECSRDVADDSWVPFRALSPDGIDDFFDLYVNLQPVEWIPLERAFLTDASGQFVRDTAGEPIPTGCNVVDHTYRINLDVKAATTVNFKVKRELPYSWNSGNLVVQIYLVRAPLEIFGKDP